MAVAQTHVDPKKIETVEMLIELLERYSTIALVRIEGIVSSAMHQIRRDLRGEAVIVMAKNTLMKRAIDLVKDKKPGLENLKEHIKGPMAFLLTNTNPFKIATYLDNKKLPAPAKAGMIAPNDVLVTKRNTGIPPGPVIGELNAAGLPTRIEQGTIAITKDTVVLRKGERVSRTLSAVLSRLEILPFQVGIVVEVAWDNGSVIDGATLVVDFEEIQNQMVAAHQQALNLAVNAPIYVPEAMSFIIAKAHREALSLASEAAYLTPETASVVLGHLDAKAKGLIAFILSKSPEALPEDYAQMVAATPIGESAASAKSEEAAEEEEEEEEISEEEVGLGGLFG